MTLVPDHLSLSTGPPTHTTMNLALTRVFGITELTALIALFLDKRDISRLLQTSHGFYDIFSPSFYNEIDLIKDDRRLTASPDAMLALSRNASLVRTLKMGAISGITYLGGVMAQQRLSDTEAQSNIDQPSSSSTPAEFPQAPVGGTNPSPIILFSPFSHLTRLYFVIIATHKHYHSNRAQGLINSGKIVTSLCDILDLSPRLQFLSMTGMHIKSRTSLSRLATTIAELTSLEGLYLGLLALKSDEDYLISVLFFNFPERLATLDLRLHFFMSTQGRTMELPLATAYKQLEQRPTPLRHLTRLFLMTKHSISLDTFRFILRNCPELTSINIPWIKQQEDFSAVAEMLVQSCPRLQDLQQTNGSHDKEGALLFATAEYMDKDTLASLYFRGLNDEEGGLRRVVARHSGSLTCIILDICSTIRTVCLQTILFNCAMLEMLEVTGDSPEKFKISLGDAVAKPWATSRLRKLHLVVDIGDNTILLRDRTDPFGWLQDDIRKKQLDQLFREIGKQTELRSLELRVAVDEDGLEDEDEEILVYKNFFFPGMLTLHDATVGRHGFLGLLAGLKNLQFLWARLLLGTQGTGV